MSKKSSGQRKGRVRVRRLNRHVMHWKKTGKPSEWLMRQCMERPEVCRKLMPELAELIHPQRMWSYMHLVRQWNVANPRQQVQISGITVP